MSNLNTFKKRCIITSAVSGGIAIFSWFITGVAFEGFLYSLTRFSSISSWNSSVIQVTLCVIAASVIVALVAAIAAVAASLLIAYRKDSMQQ